jgi:hypothetical protein
MLDKGQIKDWDGEPEPESAKAPGATVTPSVVAPPMAQRPDLASMISGAREALPTGERVTLTHEQVQARKRRSQWIALALFAFVIIIFVLTMNKVGSGMALPQVYNMQGAQ